MDSQQQQHHHPKGLEAEPVQVPTDLQSLVDDVLWGPLQAEYMKFLSADQSVVTAAANPSPQEPANSSMKAAMLHNSREIISRLRAKHNAKLIAVMNRVECNSQAEQQLLDHRPLPTSPLNKDYKLEKVSNV